MNKKKVLIADLKPGMFVYELDRPWVDTPFLFQGFIIDTAHQLEELGRYCKYVYVDPLRSLDAGGDSGAREGTGNAAPGSGDATSIISNAVVYEDRASVEQELREAEPIRNTVYHLLQSVQEEVRNSRRLNTTKLRDALSDMVDSVIRNPNALLLLTQLKEKDVTTLGYAIDVAIYILAFGRHLGLHPDELRALGLGGLLLDIGKIRLPEQLLAKKTMLTAEEHGLMKTHVQRGVDILSATPEIPAEVIEMLATHHEREDGSGYPAGLSGDDIGLFGKMAGIVDCFNDLTIDRPYASRAPHHVALQLLHQWRHQFFNGYLIDEFTQCMGVYPVGSLVELNTGEIAVVIGGNSSARLKPKVVLALDAKKTPYSNKRMVDLSTSDSTAQAREIKRGLESGMYGIDPRAYLPE